LTPGAIRWILRELERELKGGSMGYELRVDGEGRLARVSLFGQTSVEELRRCLSELVNHPDWSPDFEALVDARRLVDPNLPYQQVRDVAQYTKRLNERLGTGRHALVGDTDLLYGSCRMGEQLCQPCSRELVVFRDVEGAERWLGIREEEPSPHSRIRPRDPQGQPEADDVYAGKKR
jgi:hypothetical protein